MRVSILGDLFISQYYTHFKQEVMKYKIILEPKKSGI